MTNQKETTGVISDLQNKVIVISDFLTHDERKRYEEWRSNKIKSKSKPIDAW